jgi:HTH-type transcriptional regulator/antitoxin HigA
MTLTFNPEKYTEMLVKYQPKLIKTEVENEQALTVIEELMHKANRTLEEDELYQLLILLVEKFEREYYLTGQTANPQSILLLLIEQKAIKKSDLVDVIGSEGVVSEVVSGKRILSKNQAEALAEFFNVSAELFI